MWGHPWTRKLTPTRYQTCWCLDIELPTPQSHEKWISIVCKLPSVWYFVMATWVRTIAHSSWLGKQEILSPLPCAVSSLLWCPHFILRTGISHFPCSCDKIPDLRKQGLFWLEVWGYRPSSREGMGAEACACSSCIGSQEAKMGAGAHPSFCLLFTPGSQAMGWSHLRLECVKSPLLD